MKLSLVSLLSVIGLTLNLSAQTIANYQAVVASQNPSNWFKLDSTLASAVNPGVVLTSFAGGYGPDAYRSDSNCWSFTDQNTAYLKNLSDPIISGGGTADANAAAKGSITFIFRMLSGQNIGGQRWLFDATTNSNVAISNHNALSLYLENDTSTNSPTNSLLLRFGDVTTTILQASNISYGSWYFFAMTYDEARVPNKAIWYLGPAGGTLLTGMTTNAADAVAGMAMGLIIGNRGSDGNGAYRSPGRGRIDEFAIWARELSFTEISNQFSKLPPLPPPGASYQQVIQAEIPNYYFKLDNSLVESIGNTLSLTANGDGGAFTTDFFGNANSAYSFSATNDSLSITNDLISGGGPTQDTTASGVGTISFLFRMLNGLTNSGQRYIFSAPGDEVNSTDDNSLALFLENFDATTNNPGSLKLRAGNTTKGNVGVTDPVPIAYGTNLVPNAWYYFAMTYDEGRNTPEVFIFFGPAGGTLTSTSFNPANSSVIGDNGPLVMGNKIQAGIIGNNAFRNPGNGAIDEFAIWHDELSTAEITAQFNALVSRPTLGIAVEGGNAILSWPNTTPTNFVLETASALVGQTWINAGSPTTVGSSFFVTNNLSAGAGFFRLHKQ